MIGCGDSFQEVCLAESTKQFRELQILRISLDYLRS